MSEPPSMRNPTRSPTKKGKASSIRLASPTKSTQDLPQFTPTVHPLFEPSKHHGLSFTQTSAKYSSVSVLLKAAGVLYDREEWDLPIHEPECVSFEVPQMVTEEPEAVEESLAAPTSAQIEEQPAQSEVSQPAFSLYSTNTPLESKNIGGLSVSPASHPSHLHGTGVQLSCDGTLRLRREGTSFGPLRAVSRYGHHVRRMLYCSP